jgi:hypothetical protein
MYLWQFKIQLDREYGEEKGTCEQGNHTFASLRGINFFASWSIVDRVVYLLQSFLHISTLLQLLILSVCIGYYYYSFNNMYNGNIIIIIIIGNMFHSKY